MPPGILSVKLGRPRGMPRKRLEALLEQTRRDCCRARNAAVTHWLLWRRQNPTWEPGGDYTPPARKIRRSAKRKREQNERAKERKDPAYAPREFLSRELYGVAIEAVPTLNTSVASSCKEEVIVRLKAKTPYNHDGDAEWVWQAILDAEVSLPTWRGGRIPCPRSVMRLEYTDDHCTLRFPLLSKKSGYRILSPTVNLDVADLTRGKRRILRKLATGEMRLADSQIVEAKGKWYAQLCYQVPVNAVDLPKDRVLILRPALPDDPRPFTCEWMDEEGHQRHWDMGNGKPLVAEHRRVIARRRAIRHRYSDGCGSGHGRQRWAKSIKPMSRYVVDMCSRFQKQTVADIIKLAIRERCGTILYREPTMPVREHCWFAKHDVPMDWVAFEARLAFKCEISGLDYDKQRIGMAEWRPKKDAG